MAATDQYNVVIVSPPGYRFSETFREVGETLLFALRDLGHTTELSVNSFDESAVNVILGGHLLDEERISCLPPRSIIYNFEQVHGDSQWIKPLYVDLIRRYAAWDYSARNIEMWNRFCPGARVARVPLGYVPQLSRIAGAEVEDIDVLFYGVVNERRARVLKGLENAGLNVVAITGKFGAERDALIARAKVVLNVHFFETKIFEVVRASYLLANRKAVVSELDTDTEIEDEFRGAIAGVPYANLIEKCVELVFDDTLRRDLADKGFSCFSRRPETAILDEALRTPPPDASSADLHLPTRLNVGSGKGWNLECLNLDVDPLWMPDVVADLNEALPLADPVDLGRFGVRVMPEAHFEEIHASHVLEHIPNLIVAMESFLRLLRVGGILSVEVPYDLSHGAWQDPTHVRAMNERSWLYYTEWFWYLGWHEYRFETKEIQYLLSDFGRELMASGKSGEEVTRIPRAVDAMRVRLAKVPLSDAEKQKVARRWTA